jgi:hypothetical protein
LSFRGSCVRSLVSCRVVAQGNRTLKTWGLLQGD